MQEKGFTLIEAMFTTLILVTGLSAIAGVVVYGVRTSERIQQEVTAFVLVAEKMEQLKLSEIRTPGLRSEFIGDPQTFIRTWEISEEVPQRVTVTVSARQHGSPERYLELARASTLVGPQF
jgi:type II secretory pathway pseudopilin PulG